MRPVDFQYRIIHITMQKQGAHLGLNLKMREDRVIVYRLEKGAISESGAFEVGDRILDVDGTPVASKSLHSF